MGPLVQKTALRREPAAVTFQSPSSKGTGVNLLALGREHVIVDLMAQGLALLGREDDAGRHEILAREEQHRVGHKVERGLPTSADMIQERRLHLLIGFHSFDCLVEVISKGIGLGPHGLETSFLFLCFLEAGLVFFVSAARPGRLCVFLARVASSRLLPLCSYSIPRAPLRAWSPGWWDAVRDRSWTEPRQRHALVEWNCPCCRRVCR